MLDRLLGRQSTLVEAAFRDLSVMLEESQKMYRLAVRSLLENEPLEADLRDLDDIVDDSERMVRRTVLQHLTMNPGHDLVTCLSLISIVQDAERIGDFARGLAEIVDLADQPRSGPFVDRLRDKAERVDLLFDDCEKAYVGDDASLAASVVDRAAGLKAELMEITADVARSEVGANRAVVYVGTARILRRISAHLSNICSTLTQPFDRIRHGDETA